MDGDVTITIDGLSFALPDLDDMSLDELFGMQELLGMPLDEAQEKMKKSDARMFAAVLYVGWKRVDETVTPADVRQLKLSQLQTAVEERAPEVADPRPPESGGAHELQHGSAKSNGGDTESAMTIPATPGAQR